MGGGEPTMDQFELYFIRADSDRDDRISGAGAVSFFQASGLPTPVLAQIWTYADQNRTGYLARPEFYNALKLVTVTQTKMDLTSDIVKAALHGPASATIPPPLIDHESLSTPQSNSNPTPPVQQPNVVHNQQLQPNNQQIPVRSENIPFSQSWPKMTQSNVQNR